jgi:predicted transcriptional regulator
MNRSQKIGWIYLHKSLLEWEWYDDINVFRLFIHLLLKANYTATKWHGIEIKRGQHPTGRFSLSKETGLSEQQVRTALNKLISTNEITKESTSQYTIITITNYDKYQSSNQVPNQRATNEQPTNNHSLIKINKNKKKNKYISGDLERVVRLYNQIFGKNISSTKGFETNYEYWKEVHGIEKIQQALENASRDKFWKDKMTLTILFRRKNTNGETVDYIEDLSSRNPSSKGSVAII